MAEKETGWFLTEGGAIYEMDLPLTEAIAQRVEKGAIVRVANADGDPYEPAKSPREDSTLDQVAMYAPPPQSASKAAWEDYAVRHGRMTPEGARSLTKADLVEKFGGR